MSLVSVETLNTYEASAADAVIERHFAALSVDADLHPGLKVLIKPNLISAHRPEQAVTTHPALIGAVVRYLRRRGVTDIVIADSPSGPYQPEKLKAIYQTAGLLSLEPDARLNYDTSFEAVSCPEGFCVRSFNRIRPAVRADYIINMAKCKTHGMVTLTAGVKNLFGTIPGLQKPEMHYRFPDVDSFSRMLLDLARSAAPQITIIDAVDAMEGNGPTGGTLRHVGLTFASRDVFTQDWYLAKRIGFAPEEISLLRQALELGLARPDELVLTGSGIVPGQEFEPLDPPFRMPDTASVDFATRYPRFLRKPIVAAARRLFRPVPLLKAELCIGCGRCAESCPQHIIRIRGGKAHFGRKGCISCFCCQEMCPRQAIGVKRRIRG